ncbi:MAG: pyruvate kinase [Thermodesulfobacteriota bacterium]
MNELQDIRRTKIVCTLGPATSSPEMIRSLLRAGMNVARLNFSHGDHGSHRRTIQDLRDAAAELGQEVGILQDLAGPKIRLGELAERRLEPGDEVRLVSGQCAPSDCIPVNYPYLYEDVAVGNRILLADGKVELIVSEKDHGEVHCHVVVGGTLTSHKGVNLPTSDLRIEAFTEKDRRDLEFGLAAGVDFVAMSFVRHERDLAPLREMMAGLERPPLLIAKIEKPQAVERLDEILCVVDGVMVARGDLGVEMDLEEVPVVQKRIIHSARLAGRVVITATQMLGSMVASPRPSRAEVTDVANAVLDGTDAVMLSDETAMGKYPVESVKVLDKVCRYAEPQLDSARFLGEDFSPLLPLTEAAISRAAGWLAGDLEIAAIVAATTSGSTVRLMARFRPPLTVVGASTDRRTCRQLCLSWGVVPALIPTCRTVDDIITHVRNWVTENGVAGPGDRLILTAGIPLQKAGTTNMIKVVTVEGPPEKGN